MGSLCQKRSGCVCGGGAPCIPLSAFTPEIGRSVMVMGNLSDRHFRFSGGITVHYI